MDAHPDNILELVVFNALGIRAFRIEEGHVGDVGSEVDNQGIGHALIAPNNSLAKLVLAVRGGKGIGEDCYEGHIGDLYDEIHFQSCFDFLYAVSFWITQMSRITDSLAKM